MLRIGFSATYGFNSIGDAVSFASINNFNAIEINLNIPEFFPERYSSREACEIVRQLESSDIKISFHAPEDINLCTKQKHILDASITRLKECINFAETLGGSRFTFHIGDSVNFTMYDGNMRMEDYYMEDYLGIMKASIGELCQYTPEDIMLCAENTGYFSTAKMHAIESMLGCGLYLTWDIGHSFIKKGQQEFMMKNIGYVRNAHIHDVCGGKDHSIIGTGQVDMPYYLTLLDNKNLTFIIEVRPGEAAVKSYENLNNIIKALGK